ncbi:MAG: glyoxylate carboligase [Chloroflexi bacterium]|nr:glyoxylate carboligase [Chloroflexota bacterium]
MPKMPCMQAAVQILESEGVDYVFGIPGANINAFYAALARSTRIKHIIARHEEGASHAAEGWARASGRVGVCVGTSGPAGTNFITGLYNAQADSIPLIAITGQHVRAMQGKEGFQAMDITEVARPVTKKTFYVRESANVPWVFREAFRIAREGRPGPVLIDLPIDVQRGEVDYDPAIDSPLPIHKPEPDLRKIRRAMEMMLEAERPVILIGGGVIIAGASEETAELAEYLQVPVVNTSMAKGALPANHPLYAGEVGIQCNTLAGNRVFLESDFVLAIGCRFADRHTGTLDVYTRGRKFVHVDVEPTQISRIFPADLGIVSDAKLALRALIEAARTMTPPRRPTERVWRLPGLRRELARRMDYDDVPIKPGRVFKEINEFFDEDTIFVTCIGNNQIWSGQMQEIFKPGHYLLAGGAGPLGWDLPAALGVKLARPHNTVVNVTGDFGIQFCIEELAMAAQYRIPVLVVILNNGNMSLIRQNQKYAYGGLRFAVDLRFGEENENLVDFVRLTEAFGLYGERVTRPEEIKGAFRRGLASGRTALIDILIDPDADSSMGQAIDAIREFEPLPELQLALR